MKNGILVINGPNINLLGKREINVYGNETYENLCERIDNFAKNHNIDVEIFQSNHEGEIIDRIHQAEEKYRGIVLNAGALSHYSISLKDAIKAINIPVIEVHLSNIYNREDYRKVSVISDVCIGQICGFGYKSYLLGIAALIENDEV